MISLHIPIFTSVVVFCLLDIIEGQKLGDKGLENDLDSNITKVCEELRSLDKELTQMYTNPEDDKGEELLQLTERYNQASLNLLSLCSKSKRRVMKAAQDILDHGGPHFLDVDFNEETLKDAFKWEQESMDKLSMMRLKIGEHWFDLWSLYKKMPDYDYPEYT